MLKQDNYLPVKDADMCRVNPAKSRLVKGMFEVYKIKKGRLTTIPKSICIAMHSRPARIRFLYL